MMRNQSCTLAFMIFVKIITCHANSAFAKQAEEDFLDMSLKELMSIPVTSVSKKPQNLSDSAAAIFVITSEDLLRSGATSIPEALRMVPGLHVGRIDSNKWAVSSRGFNNRFTKKLLVLVDGRTVYTPGFSGVYWEVQDVVLEDIDRIEVIRGPGASLWGANAVNGVINIITKHTSETQGTLVSGGAGTVEKSFGSIRYGTSLGEGVHGRIYAKYFDRDEFEYETGENAGDSWDSIRTGFRLDSKVSGPANFTFQGDLYLGNIEQNALNVPIQSAPYSIDVEDDVDMSGGNLLFRAQRILSSSSDLTVQAYYDRTSRDDFYVSEERDSFDLELQYRFSPYDDHDFVWGAGYRYTGDDMTKRYVLSFEPDSRSDQLYNTFLQDEITLIDDTLWLILGTKLEHNDYSGFETQPSGRFLWTPHAKHRFWTALSRAVRTPSRVEHDGDLNVATLPPPSPSLPFPIRISLKGDESFEPEELTAYEAGYRFIPDQSYSFDIAFFYNHYEQLQGYKQLAPVVNQGYIDKSLLVVNQGENNVRGFEISAVWQPAEWLKNDISYSYLDSDVQESGMAKNQVSLRTGIDLPNNVDVDFWLRYVDDVKASRSGPIGLELYDIDGHLSLDIRLAWQMNKRLEFSVVGQNLLESGHVEFVQEAFIEPTEIPRSFYAQFRYSF